MNGFNLKDNLDRNNFENMSYLPVRLSSFLQNFLSSGLCIWLCCVGFPIIRKKLRLAVDNKSYQEILKLKINIVFHLKAILFSEIAQEQIQFPINTQLSNITQGLDIKKNLFLLF